MSCDQEDSAGPSFQKIAAKWRKGRIRCAQSLRSRARAAVMKSLHWGKARMPDDSGGRS